MRFAAASVVLIVGGCTTIPELPDDGALPVQEILLHATCELRDAFRSLNQDRYARFGAPYWSLSVSLTPKVDRELTANAGLTGKNSSQVVKFATSWTIGTAPGAQINVRGHRDGSVSYVLVSEQLIDKDNKLPLDCNKDAPNYHALTQILGVQRWLERTAEALDGQVGTLARIDKPSFSSEIYIKYNGSGTFTYTYPFGTDFAGLGASYYKTETLSIQLTPRPPVVQARTLPSGGEFGPARIATTGAGVSAETLYRLDQLQLEQTLRNLRVQPQ